MRFADMRLHPGLGPVEIEGDAGRCRIPLFVRAVSGCRTTIKVEACQARSGSILFDARPIQVLTLYGILHQPKSET